MSGRLGDLSAEQQAALEALQQRIKDVATPRCDEPYLLRFLRSRNFNLDKTEKKLRDALEFHKKWGSDTILEDWTPPPLCVQYMPGGMLPDPDKQGRPVPVLSLGQIDMKGLMKCHKRDDLIRYKIYQMERLERRFKERSKEDGKLIDQVTAIVDMNGLSAYQLWRPGVVLFTEFLQIEEMYYPEVVHKGFFIRTPRIFPTVYALVKPFVDPNTREKLDVLGSNWKDRLHEMIDPSHLPEVYGGTLNEVPGVCWGGRIPKELYTENDESLQHVYVKPGKKFTIEVTSTVTNVDLAWEFVTENHDIGFAVYHQNESGEMVEVIPSERLAAHHTSVEGSYTCERVGLYVMEWDNSFSWTRGKNLRYKYSVNEPSTD